jgi:hypothetical protein
MTLPRSFRRTAQRWVVNATTVVALTGSVWISAHQRLLPVSDESVSPAAAETGTKPLAAPAAVARHDVVASDTTTAKLADPGIDGTALRRVAFGAATKR